MEITKHGENAVTLVYIILLILVLCFIIHRSFEATYRDEIEDLKLSLEAERREHLQDNKDYQKTVNILRNTIDRIKKGY